MTRVASGAARIRQFFAPTNGDPLVQRHLGSGLGRRAARGAVSTVVTQWARLVLTTAATVVLARMLTPSDYGLVGMVSALLGVGDSLWNVGLQMATVQRRDVGQSQVSFFFWLQSSLGMTLTLVTCASAPLIVGFYHKPTLYPIIYAQSLTFFLGGLIAQHRAVLSRQMRFALLAMIDLISLAVGTAAAIVVAAIGGAYWAIVTQTLVALIIQGAIYWHTSGWRPSRPRRLPGAWPWVSFGLNLSLTNLMTYVGQNADNVLIGKVYGSAPLGIYSRAYNLLLLPARQIQTPMGRVAVPVLSYLQDQPDRYRRYYHAATSALCYLAMPLMTTLAALSPDVVALLLGPKWEAVAPIFRILAIAGVFQTLRAPNSWIFTSTGHTGRQATWSVITQPVRIGSFFIGIHWGVAGVSWAYTISTLIVLVPAIMWGVKDTPLSLHDVWAAAWRPLVVCALTFAFPLGAGDLLRPYGHLPATAAGVLCAAAVLGLAYALWPGVRSEIQGLRSVFGRRSDESRRVYGEHPPPAPAGIGEMRQPTAGQADDELLSGDAGEKT